MTKKKTNEQLEKRILELETQLMERDERHENLRADSLRYQNVLEEIPFEVHIWQVIRNDDGEIITWQLDYANRAALAVWGEVLDEVVGKTTDEIFHGVNATAVFMPIVRQLFATNKPVIWEEKFEGTGQILQMISAPAGAFFFSAGIDVTEQREMEGRLNQVERMEAIGQLAGGIAHDFNNQLAGILGYAEALKQAISDRELLEAVTNIEQAAERSADLTGQLLAFARRGPADFIPLNTETLVNSTVSLLKHTLDKNTAIESTTDCGSSCISGDASLLNNALLNVVLNARDSLPDGGTISLHSSEVMVDAILRSELDITLSDGRYFRLDVTDTGCGIPKEDLEKVFTPFFTTKHEGNGMGLASVQGTLHRHGGDILVQSKLGKGTCVSIYLPVVNEGIAKIRSPQQTDIEDFTPLRILVLDDEAQLCQLYKKLLSRHGHQVSVFERGPEALNYYKENWPQLDLVILDINMPTLSGPEVFIQMQRINPSVKALMVTGYGIEPHDTPLRELGVLGCLQKPFREADLLCAIRETRAEPSD